MKKKNNKKKVINAVMFVAIVVAFAGILSNSSNIVLEGKEYFSPPTISVLMFNFAVLMLIALVIALLIHNHKVQKMFFKVEHKVGKEFVDLKKDVKKELKIIGKKIKKIR